MWAHGRWAGNELSHLRTKPLCSSFSRVLFGFAVYCLISVLPHTEDVVPETHLEIPRPLLSLPWAIVGLDALTVLSLTLSPRFDRNP